MRFKELGKGVEVIEVPYGIFLNEYVYFATTPDGRHYVNLKGTENGFERIDEIDYNNLMSTLKNVKYLVEG
jgi:hypothetical protein